MERTNDQWLADLQDDQRRSAALTDLRPILLGGLRRGLIDQVNIAGPQFDVFAEDFVQEALLKILANLETFRGNSKFTTWAHKITVRVALTELRRARWKNFSLDAMLADDPFSQAFPDQQPTPALRVEQYDLLQNIQRIIDEELTEKQRMVLMLVPIGGLPMDEAARRMGMKRNALYKLLHDARLKLKRRLQDEGLRADEVLATFAS